VVTDDGIGLFGGFGGPGMDVPLPEPEVEGLKEQAEVLAAPVESTPLVVQSAV
jgi:hypothetical protein